ncbi:exodeoxyribonuclease VII small subunit [Botrimarina sp.]|uniref:exodeoxyribonuclease VII small subunit n=1 Tax=Botrimarina sp. TaxID=2795802 RepID=UPI0032EAEC00
MAKKKATPPSTEAPADEPFEESLAKLEEIVESLEGGELGLADALARYEEGVRRLRRCHEQLEAAERRIELLSGIDADGNPVTEPFDDSATADAPATRAEKRTAKRPKSSPFEGGAAVDDPNRLF